MLPSARLLWLWFLLAVLALAAPFSLAARWSAEAFALALLLLGLADFHLSRSRLDEVSFVPAADPVRAAQGRAFALEWRIEQSPPRRRRLRLALGAGSPALERAITLPEEVFALSLPAAPRASWSAPAFPRRRGVFHDLRLAVECDSRLGLWTLRVRRRFPLAVHVHPDARAARRAVFSSEIFRRVAGAQRRPTSGQGREFERLRDYLPGDSYQDVAWKATARRDFPVVRVHQWEQMQEIYFLLDYSRLSARPVELPAGQEGPAPRERAPFSVLDLYAETALAAASTCHELGDRFGLIAFADQVGPALAAHAGSGRAGGGMVSRCRELLAALEPAATTPDYAALAVHIRARLRRRALLVLLTQVGDVGRDEELLRALELARGPHALAVHSLLPPETAPLPFALFAAGSGAGPALRAIAAGDSSEAPARARAPRAASLDEVYRRLAGHREYRRLAELRRRFALRGLSLRLSPPAAFLRGAVETFLESKRAQTL